MRSSLIGTLLFVVVFAGVNAIVFGWSPAANWRLYGITTILYFAVNEAIRRTGASSAPSTRE